MARLPRELEALAGVVDLPGVFDALAGGGFPHDLDVFAGAGERVVEDPAMPRGNGFIRDPEPQEEPSAGHVLERGGLDPERHRAPPVDVIDGGAELQRPRAGGHAGKEHHRVGAVGFPFPEGAEPRGLDQGSELHDPGGGVVGR